MEVQGRPVSPLIRSSSETEYFLTGTPAPGNEDGASEKARSGLRETIPAVVEMKRKRGRPRKYDVLGGGGASMGHVLPCPTPLSVYSLSSSPPLVKRGRGRPRGSGKLQKLASLGGLVAATAGRSFIPHVIIVESGEDVVSKIVSFSENVPRAVCVLSATGAVSAATLRLSPSGFLRQEGPFEILSLSGFQVCSSTSGPRQRMNGKLTVQLSRPNGRVFGGPVGSMIAACPIQLIMGSFKQDISSQLRRISAKAARAASVVNSANLVRVPVQVQMAPADVDLISSFLASTEAGEGNPIAANPHMDHISLLNVGDQDDFLAMPQQKPSIDITSGHATL